MLFGWPKRTPEIQHAFRAPQSVDTFSPTLPGKGEREREREREEKKQFNEKEEKEKWNLALFPVLPPRGEMKISAAEKRS